MCAIVLSHLANAAFMQIFIIYGSYNLAAPFSGIIPEPIGRGCGIVVLFRPQSLILCTLTGCESLY